MPVSWCVGCAAAEVLFALGHPLSLLVLLVTFVLAMALHGWVQSITADRGGDRRPRQEGRLTLDPRHHLDPFGAMAAALSGLGWARPVDGPVRRSRGRLLAVTLSGPAVNVLLGLALLLSARLSTSTGFTGGASYLLQHGIAGTSQPLAQVLLLAGASQLYLGVLSLVPLPPLDGGRLLFGLAPHTPGWQRAEHLLVEQNVGTVALLVLLILPLGGTVPVLPTLLDTVLTPVLRAVAGG